MRQFGIGKMILRALATALVLVLPWTAVLAEDVADWAELSSAYNGWENEYTLTADITADSVLTIPTWRGLTITLNDHTITPPAGEVSAFMADSGVGADTPITYVVDDAAEFQAAASDPHSKTIKLAGNITLTTSVVLKNAQKIDQGEYSLTLQGAAKLNAEAATEAILRSALANASITSVVLTDDIVLQGDLDMHCATAMWNTST